MSTPCEAPRPRPLHTTTVRFDADLWDRICLHSAMLSVGKATLINMAVRDFIARHEAARELEPTIQETISGLERRLRRVEAVLHGSSMPIRRLR